MLLIQATKKDVYLIFLVLWTPDLQNRYGFLFLYTDAVDIEDIENPFITTLVA